MTKDLVLERKKKMEDSIKIIDERIEKMQKQRQLVDNELIKLTTQRNANYTAVAECDYWLEKLKEPVKEDKKKKNGNA